MTYNIGDIVKAPSSTNRILRNSIPPEVGDLFRVTRGNAYISRGAAVSGRPSNDGHDGDHQWYLRDTWEVVTPADSTTRPAPTVPVTETLDSVWGVGNTIEFTVTGEFNGTHIKVGCQTIRLVDARRTDVLREMKVADLGWNFTFRVKIEDDFRITHSGGSFSKADLRTHGRDFKLIEKAPEPVAPVTVEMSVEELSAVVGALGLLAAGGPTSAVWNRMHDLLMTQPSRPGDLYELVDVSSGQDLYGPRLVRR